MFSNKKLRAKKLRSTTLWNGLLTSWTNLYHYIFLPLVTNLSEQYIQWNIFPYIPFILLHHSVLIYHIYILFRLHHPFIFPITYTVLSNWVLYGTTGESMLQINWYNRYNTFCYTKNCSHQFFTPICLFSYTRPIYIYILFLLFYTIPFALLFSPLLTQFCRTGIWVLVLRGSPCCRRWWSPSHGGAAGSTGSSTPGAAHAPDLQAPMKVYF